jgi:hypothetical protein
VSKELDENDDGESANTHRLLSLETLSFPAYGLLGFKLLRVRQGTSHSIELRWTCVALLNCLQQQVLVHQVLKWLDAGAARSCAGSRRVTGDSACPQFLKNGALTARHDLQRKGKEGVISYF